ncbi:MULTISPECIES: hypothetical protein [Pseudophaeobacter]|jgi:hypothetical protein|uniref:hypothetical protein n=1 Tax=Pseudophaeobacter TaxID=1541822 RepID=UPI00242C8822|nr:hypothetical protein [Pseudophaeobacter profundi]
MTSASVLWHRAPGRVALRAALLVGCVAVAGCSEQKKPNADAATLAAASYVHNGPPALTLFTMVNNRTGAGGHTSLMINASERVIFDPAGSFYADVVPERNDVLFGITPPVVLAYRGAHARSTHHVVMQRLEVTPAQAQRAYELAVSNGRVAGAYCANSTASILRQLPGFEDMKVTFYPVKLSEQFAAMPGVVTTKYYEDDDPDLQKALAEGNVTLSQ